MPVLRSVKDQTRSIDEVLLSARTLPKDMRGLDDSTVRRHVKSLDLVLKRAAAEGHRLAADVDIGGIRPKTTSKTPAHKRRAVFRIDEAKRAFGHTLWQGARSKGRRHEPGSVITRDAHYWIPLILAYSGARRAEVAGLLAEDIREVDGIPCMMIQSNEFRGIKGEAPDPREEERKTRIVPLHSHLIDLGLLEHAARALQRGDRLLFPDVVPTPRKGSRRAAMTDPALAVDKFGDSIDDG